MQPIKNKLAVEDKKFIKLSIQFSLDGFSFCIKTKDNTVVFFNKIDFEKTLTSFDDLLEKLKTSFKTEKELQQDFAEVLAIHENNLFALVPDEFFDESKLKTYLDYNIKTLKTDFFAFDSLAHLSINNVYIPYVNINNYLFQHFGEFTYKHNLSALIEKLFDRNLLEENSVILNVSNRFIDIVYGKNDNLVFANTFQYNTKEDFMYYLLFVLEQLKLKIENVELKLIGDIYEKSEIYKMLFMYIKNISFLKSSSPIFNNLHYGNHSNYILLG